MDCCIHSGTLPKGLWLGAGVNALVDCFRDHQWATVDMADGSGRCGCWRWGAAHRPGTGAPDPARSEHPPTGIR